MKKSDKDEWTGFNMGRPLFTTPGVEQYDEFIIRFVQGILKGKDTAVEYGCFPAYTPILNADYEELEITDVQIGDVILSGQGIERSVSKTFERNYTGSIINVETCGLKESLKPTPEHPFLSISREDLLCSKHGGDTLCNGKHHTVCDRYNCISTPPFLKMDYRPINTLKVGDYLAIPIPYEKDAPLIHNEGLLDLFGYYLAEGNILYCRGIEHGVNFTFGDHEAKLVEEVRTLLLNQFDYQAIIKHRPEKNQIAIQIFNKEVGLLFKKYCGEYSHHKRIHPRLMRTLPPQALLRMFYKHAKGDGHHRKFNGVCGNLTSKTVSPVLGSQLWWILVKNRIIASIKNYDGAISIIVPRNQMSKISEDYRESRKGAGRRFESGGYIFTPITHIEKEEYKGKVHNLRVPIDDTYTAGNLVVHNCGDGVWLRYLAKHNRRKKFIGVEWNDSLYDYCMAQPAMENLEFVQADMSEPEGVFECDVCYSLGGIEHFSEPVTVLKTWVDKLSPDGICFLTVPNLMNRERLKRRFGLPPEVYLGVDWVALDVFGYQEIWAPNYFIRIAMKSGLEVMELGSISCLKADPLYLKGLKRSDQL